MITDQMLLLYQRCDRLAFLEAYGDRTRQDPPSDFLLKIRRESITFEDQTAQESKTVAEKNAPDESLIKISHRAENWLEGTKATLELMEQGFDRIYRGILSISPSGIPLVSYPTFLIKQPGSSKFGDWLYTTADVRGGKRPKQEYQIVAAFHAWLLENIQGVRPDQALLILREKGNYHVNLTLRLPQMHDILGNLITTLEEKKEPDVIISRQKCSLCQWYNSCHQIAQSRNHLCLIPGVTPNRYQHLLDLNITTINQLANSQPENFSDIPEFDNGVAEKIIKQAKSSAEKRPLANINTLQNRAKIYQLLPDSPVELYFDIEANPDFDVDYLLGVLVIDQRDHTEKYYPFFADKPEKQGIIWQQFLDLVWSYPIAPIFHFCDYEAQTIRRFAQYYQTPNYLWQPLLKRFIDIHARITQTVTLPVESYALKHLARWVGFQWRNPTANGAQCVCWYEDWINTGNQHYVDEILAYNEDDCRATYLVKDWLLQFLTQIPDVD